MTNFVAVKDESELELLETGDDVLSIDVDLLEGDRKSGFHTQNDREDPFQRSNVVQRKGAVDVKCTCVDTVHGSWGPDEPDTSATLLVLLFRFDSRRRARRVALANIEFAFFDSQGRSRKNPEVAAISFDDSFSLVPTQRTESTTTGASGTTGVGVVGAELSSTVKWERTVDEETTDAAYVIGSIDRLKAPAGPDNAATWTLKENSTTKKGVPAAMRVGILLKRSTDDDFFCTVKIETEVDLKTRIEQLLGRRGLDDPILFRTSLPPTRKLMKYDAENLGEFDLSLIEDVTVTTVRSNAVKEK
ncbi:hypothetical protein CORC01_06610 [Colletotrichum orchidophilum]|uniref:Uncharacterized protein n=1 Tax=Colletotrichum orchidophilum TaxID=1209926 RepID=A0A1G4B9T6_9PEZI|nr:uncharacterized protein CORC01_06610 [Colletotrichum orchidophilum]OHE98096.1 hypothetical protein CORC01_06610 [Colletotrichum orchidophilum]